MGNRSARLAALALAAACALPAQAQRNDVLWNAGTAGRVLVDKAVAIYREAGSDLAIIERTGGGTDAAYAALSGKPVIESLGLPGFGYHSNQAEYVAIDAIPRRLYLAVRMIADLGAGR